MRELANRIGTLKIMIVYASFGDGHRQAAAALQSSFSALGAADVRLVDLWAEAHPLLNEFSRFFYRKSYSLWPQAYGLLYEATRGMKPDSAFSHWLHSFGADRLRKLLGEMRPDAVVHTFPQLVLPILSGKGLPRVPTYNVVTDFDLHMRWVHPKVDKYYVATEDLREELAGTGIPRSRIAATGIPLRFSRLQGRPAPEAAERYGLDPARPTVLLMAGTLGAGGARELIQRLSREERIQIAVVCGRNLALETAMRRAFSAAPPGGSRVRVFGYVDKIDELMALSSCIMTKPGGLTLSEAMLAGLPILLYRPLPGQEKNNAMYLAAKGAAVVCRSPADAADRIGRLLDDPTVRQHMRAAARALAKEDAADRIALDIVLDLPVS